MVSTLIAVPGGFEFSSEQRTLDREQKPELVWGMGV